MVECSRSNRWWGKGKVQSRETATPSRRIFSRIVERAEDKKVQMGILGNGNQCESSQNAGPAVYKE